MIGTQHFRIVFLPDKDQLIEAIGRLATFLERVRATASAQQLTGSTN
jgi:alanine-synthesizing transaminase